MTNLTQISGGKNVKVLLNQIFLAHQHVNSDGIKMQEVEMKWSYNKGDLRIILRPPHILSLEPPLNLFPKLPNIILP